MRWLGYLALAGLLTGCPADQPSPPLTAAMADWGGPNQAILTNAGFDPETASVALADAAAARQGGDLATARQRYEDAALAWPDLTEAWRGLAGTASAQGDAATASGAQFVLGRIETFPSEEIWVQREINAALRRYIETAAVDPLANPETIRYATRLAEYYDALYGAAGIYEGPGRPILNLGWRDLPAAAISLAASVFYVRNLSSTDPIE